MVNILVLNNCCFTQTVFLGVFDAVKICVVYGIHFAMRLAHGIFYWGIMRFAHD